MGRTAAWAGFQAAAGAACGDLGKAAHRPRRGIGREHTFCRGPWQGQSACPGSPCPGPVFRRPGSKKLTVRTDADYIYKIFVSDAPTYEQGGKGFVLLLLYSAVGTVLHLMLALFRPLLELLGGRWAYRLAERLGRYPQVAIGPGARVPWLHAPPARPAQPALVLRDAPTR